MRRLIMLFVILSMILLSKPTSAEIPPYMQFQGKATDAQDAPLNGSYKITFRIYDVESGGSPIWSERHDAVGIENGVFSMLLGGISPLDISFDKPYWISIEINTTDGTGEMPRQRITSVGYAYRAEEANRAEMADYASIAAEANRLATKEGGYDPSTLVTGQIWFEPAAGLDTNIKLLLHFDVDNGDKYVKDSSLSGHSITLQGDARLSRAAKKWGNASIYLDGNGDYLTIPYSSDWDIISSGDYTIDFWAKHNNASTMVSYLSLGDSRGNNSWNLYRTTGNQISFWILSGGSNIFTITSTGTGNILNNAEWHHIALCKVGNDYGIYVDGGLAANGTCSREINLVYALNIGILWYNDSKRGFFNGYMDEIRIQHGNPFGADPTDENDNFNPPTSAYNKGSIKFYDGKHVYTLTAVED